MSKRFRDLARALGLHHSGVARTLEILKLPDPVLEALRRHGADARLRARFSEKRLRTALAEPDPRDPLAENGTALQGAAAPALQIS